MPRLLIMDRTGHSTFEWEQNDEGSVAVAEREFTTASKKGYMAYSMKGTQGEVLRKFDPAAEEIILAPPMVGG